MDQPVPPSRQEILEKYRYLIEAEDFDILLGSPPPPSELQKEGAWLQYLGPFKGFYLFVKKNVGGTALALYLFTCNYGSFVGGLEKINEHVKIALNSVQPVMRQAVEKSTPANEFIVASSDQLVDDWWFVPPSTTTTTTTPEPSSLPMDILTPGSGLVPYNPTWGRLS